MRTIGLEKFGSFHSHPSGSIPSAGDMKACPGLHVWVIHHGIGQHTFVAARDVRNREVLLLNQPQEMALKPRLVGENLHLGTAIVYSNGRLDVDDYTTKLLKLKNETRRILLLAIKHADSYNGHVDLDAVVKEAGKTRQTVRNHLNLCLKNDLLEQYWSRGNYKFDFKKFT